MNSITLDELYDDFFDNIQIDTENKLVVTSVRETAIKNKSLEYISKIKVNENTTYKIYSKQLITDLLYNDFINLNMVDTKELSTEVIDDNLFNLKVTLYTKFGEVILNINIPDNYYPFKPPDIKFITNINDDLIYGILNTDYLKPDNWIQTNTLKYTLISIKNIIDKYEDNIFNIEKSELQNILIKLSITADIKPRNFSTDKFKIHFIPLEKKSIDSGQKKILAGYGSPSTNQDIWDINKYLENEKNKKNEIINIITIISTKQLNKYEVNSSCIIPYINNMLQNIDDIYTQDYIECVFKIIDQIYNIDKKLILELDKGISIFKKIYKNDNNIISTNLQKYIIYIDENKEKNKNDYISNLTPLQILEVSYNNNNAIKFTKEGLKKIGKDINILMSSLPVHKSSSIFMRYDSSDLSVLRFIITGPENTPYDSGCFEFKVNLSSDYPYKVPQVDFLTTNGGLFRFNPNLYANGKVCLSLLGTWSGGSGESWDPKISTIYQILLSIQSMILVECPFYNEPGYTVPVNYKEAKDNIDYNNNLYPATVSYTIINMIKNPPKYFEDVVIAHFKNKKDHILKTVKNWKITPQLYILLENTLNSI